MDYLSTFLASFLIWLMFAGIFVLWLFRKELKGHQVLHILSIVAVALVVAQVIKTIVPSDRPFVVAGTSPLTVTVPQDNSFPSSHTATAFALTFGLYYHNRKFGALLFPPAILVGFGRIMSDVHYPIDVIGGIFVASIISLLFGHKKLLNFFNRAWFTS